jgi:NTP pyrophosphatase (non-canonical NTP hydrolase)
MIEWDDYASQAAGTAIYPGRGMKLGLLYAAQGLRGEAGEVCELGKKLLRDDGGQLTAERRGKYQKELGDVCWYASQVAFECRFKLSETILRDPLNYPEQLTYVNRGGPIGINYASARLHTSAAKTGDFVLNVMPYVLDDGASWIDTIDQGRTIRASIRTGVSHVMFWVVELCTSVEISIDAVMRMNLEKLERRQEEGLLQGDGSER